MAENARPILVVDSDSRTVAVVHEACRMNRLRAAIVLSGRNDVAIALLECMHAQQSAISKIPIVALGTTPSPLSSHGVATALESPAAQTLVDAL